MSKGRQASVTVTTRVARLVQDGYAPAQIYRELFPDGPASPDHVSLKTIQRMVKGFSPPDSSGPWSLADADPEEARLVLDVLALDIDRQIGGNWPSQEFVRWVVRVRTAVPDIPREWARDLAHHYRVHTVSNEDVRYLDMVLMLRPWESEENLERLVYIAQRSHALLGPPGGVLRWALVNLVNDTVLNRLLVREAPFGRADVQRLRAAELTAKLTAEPVDDVAHE